MFKPTKRRYSGKDIDPVFGFMTVAVVLAVGCSFVLRTVVGGGPRSAQAQSQFTQSPILQGFERDTRPLIKSRPRVIDHAGN